MNLKAAVSPSTYLNPIVAAVAAVAANVGNVFVIFNVTSDARVQVMEAAVVGLVTLGFTIANSIHSTTPVTPAAGLLGAGDVSSELVELLHRVSNPTVTEQTLVSGTAAQNTTRRNAIYLIPITGASGGTVAVAKGPTSATAETVIASVAANAAASQVLAIPVAAGEYIKVTATTATIAGPAKVVSIA